MTFCGIVFEKMENMVLENHVEVKIFDLDKSRNLSFFLTFEIW